MAAGRGSRMQGFDGNKTLLPLVPSDTPQRGSRPILRHNLANLPAGPMGLVVHHQKSAVKAVTCDLKVCYCNQPQLNGTGGALLAARRFLESLDSEYVIITMGDVPFVLRQTYVSLTERLSASQLMVLGFCPPDKKQYGVLEIEGDRVRRITEWKYWKDYPSARQAALAICNAGIYAVRRHDLVSYIPHLARRPRKVIKQINGRPTAVEEFFITDLVEYMVKDGLAVGYALTSNADETMGVDDLASLESAQRIYRQTCRDDRSAHSV